MSAEIIVAIITGVVTLMGAFLMALPGIKAFRDQQKKSNAEATKTEAEATKIYSELLAESIQREVEKFQREVEKSEKFSMLQERLDVIEHEFRELVIIVCNWANGIDLLAQQIERKEEVPVWKPHQEDIDKVKKLRQTIKSRIAEGQGD